MPGDGSKRGLGALGLERTPSADLRVRREPLPVLVGPVLNPTQRGWGQVGKMRNLRGRDLSDRDPDWLVGE
jgi:hypothetical protein